MSLTTRQHEALNNVKALALAELEKPDTRRRMDAPRYVEDFGELAALGLCVLAETLPASQMRDLADAVGANVESNDLYQALLEVTAAFEVRTE